MNWWLVSSVLLWLVVLALALLLLGVLRELGALRQGSPTRSITPFPRPQEDGPPLGSSLPALSLEPFNGHGALTLKAGGDDRPSLLVFLSPMCEGCQLVTDALNDLVDHQSRPLAVVAIMRNGPVAAARAFLNIFPVHMPLVLDSDDQLVETFNVHYAPFGLLYDSSGRLIRRGSVGNADDLGALLGDTSVPEAALKNVYPRPHSSSQPTEQRQVVSLPS